MQPGDFPKNDEKAIWQHCLAYWQREDIGTPALLTLNPMSLSLGTELQALSAAFDNLL
jgi:hypothetical protein